MADIVFLVLLVAHVTAIVAWMGGGVLFVSVIAPSVSKLSPSTRGEFVASTLPRYFRFVGASAVTAVVAGLALYAYITQVVTDLSPSSSGLVSIQVGVILGLIATIILLGLAMPAGRKLVALTKQMAKTPGEDMAAQMAALVGRLNMAGRLGVALLGLTLILMVVGAEI